MIKSVRSTNDSFKPVYFTQGFNVILAERTKESSDKDSRNGLGKSLLIEIIHFCLGSKLISGDALKKQQLDNWTFILDIQIAGQDYSIKRNTGKPNIISVAGATGWWPIQPEFDKKTEITGWNLTDFNRLMGYLMFGLPIYDDGRYTPSFRSLISYFIRHNMDAFTDAFEHHRKQSVWDVQVSNTFLLGYAWQYAQEWQVLKDREKDLKSITDLRKKNLEFIEVLSGSIGELNAKQYQLEMQATEESQRLANFQIHPEYAVIREQANRLTESIQELNNLNYQARRTLQAYQEDVTKEPTELPAESVRELYEEIGQTLPEMVVQRLNDVEDFHRKLIGNRRDFLRTEIQRIRTNIDEREHQVRLLSNQRAYSMSILETQGALEEYSKIADRYSKTTAELDAVKTRIENLRKFESEKSKLKIDMENLRVNARADTEERNIDKQQAIILFNANSQALYDLPGFLSIDVGDSGFKFDVEIKRSNSDGIEKMKIFCYDLMLAQLHSHKRIGPRFLIHDSTLFADVDERQRALALLLAAESAERDGFQYICCFNSDQLPLDQFAKLNPNFDISQYVRLTLTDADETSGLLGFRF